ncbi:MAG: LamG domain-containing protein, partial [Chloroflexota bacterium]
MLNAEDPDMGGTASGLSEIRYQLNGSTEQVVSSSFTVITLGEGVYLVRFYAVDRVGNASAVASTTVVVDVTPPVFSNAEAAVAGTGVFGPITSVFSSRLVDARIKVQDAVSGLSVPAELPMPQSGLVGFWRFEGDFTDSSDQHNDLSPQGGATTTTAEKRFGTQAYFNDNTSGRRGYNAELAVISGGTNQSVTLSAWARLRNPAPLHPGDGIIGLGTPNPGIRLYTRFGNLGGVNCAAGQLQLAVTADTPIDRWMCAGSLQAGQWYHFAVVYDATSKVIKAYVDGVLGSSTTLNGGLNLGRSIEIGGDLYNDNWLDGHVDDAAVYNRALTAYEVSVLAEKVPSVPVLVSTGGGFYEDTRVNVAFSGQPGSISPEIITASNLSLPHSTYQQANQVQFTVKDTIGNTTSYAFSVLIDTMGPMPITDLVSARAEAQNLTLAWSVPLDQGLSQGISAFRVRYTT